MLSIIIRDFNESAVFVNKMLSQCSKINLKKEVIYVSNAPYRDFVKKVESSNLPFLTHFVGNIESSGEALNRGGIASSGDILLFMDSHVCFDESNILRLLDTQARRPMSVIGPAIVSRPNFPECTTGANDKGYGSAFYFSPGRPFDWKWLPPSSTTNEFKIPFVCACSFMIPKQLFDILQKYGGFIGKYQGMNFDEEPFMRLARLGYSTYSEPRAVFGHRYSTLAQNNYYQPDRRSAFDRSRIATIFINVFDEELLEKITRISIPVFGDWYKDFEIVKKDYGWVIMEMQKHAHRIDENWYFRT